MNLRLWTMILAIVTEISVVSSKKVPQTKKTNLASTNKNKLGYPSSKKIINQVWMKIKRLLQAIYDKIFWTIAEFFDGKRLYTWKLFGKSIRIVMPRMPRNETEMKKQLAKIEKLIYQNPTNRCLTAIYINIAIFVIGYGVLFPYNTYCYFRYQQARIAEENRQSVIFRPNHSSVHLNSSRNLSADTSRRTITASKKVPISLSLSPTETILEEEEMIRSEAVKGSRTKKSSADDSNEEIKLNDVKLSFKQGLSMNDTISMERINELEEGLLNLPELIDDSDETLSTSLIRNRVQRIRRTTDEESKQLNSFDDSKEEN
ncbi:Troponin C, body wall muscle [Dirofilaria immitis]